VIERVSSALKTAALVGVVLIAGWWTLFLRGKLNEHEDALAERDSTIAGLEQKNSAQGVRIAALGREVEEQARHIQALEAAMRLLKVDHRLARIEVLGRETAEDGAVTTRLRFVELDGDGKPFDRGQELAVQGKRVYVESLVVKFDDSYVEAGDFLRGTSVCFFRRVFGENQKPNDGAPLEVDGRRPRVYAGDATPDPFYDDLWKHFWRYANDPEAAAARGVRAMHGEAPFAEVEAGKSYLLELRASGGLTIRVE
jgi:hypothetical protein